MVTLEVSAVANEARDRCVFRKRERIADLRCCKDGKGIDIEGDWLWVADVEGNTGRRDVWRMVVHSLAFAGGEGDSYWEYSVVGRALDRDADCHIIHTNQACVCGLSYGYKLKRVI